MPIRRWIDSANHAIEGILEAARSQRHVRYHLYATLAAVVAGLLLGLSRGELVLVSLAAVVVIVAELLNTALEYAIDLFAPGVHEQARIAKDVAAGAVLVAAVGAVVIGCAVFVPRLKTLVTEGLHPGGRPPADVAVLSVIVVLILVILTKAFLGRGTPLRGGFPSGHAAVAFSVWVSVAVVFGVSVPTGLGFLLALAVASSRVVLGIHDVREVVWGAILGSVVTYLLFLTFT